MTIKSVATGNVAPVITPAAGARGQAAPRPEPTGLTVAGEVKNFVPVSDLMLLHPDPGDWLMIRRNYQAWNFSPLTQITAANVKNLQLAWVWMMNDSGTSEAAPLAHNGTIYLNSPGGVVQALDGRTGSLIWENRVGPTSPGFGSTGAARGLAIFDDKVFLATHDARLVALDARTGKLTWETVIADRTKGYSNTSGPIVIHGRLVQGLTGCDRYKENRMLHQRLRRGHW